MMFRSFATFGPIAVLTAACYVGSDTPDATQRSEGPSLRDAAGPNVPVVGAAIRIQGMGDPLYRAHAVQHYNHITVENAVKWQTVRPSPSTYAFDDADEIIGWATDEGLGVRGHTLVWGNFLPDWMNESLGQQGVEQQMREHIQTVVTRYAGDVEHWDVVNEAVDAGGNLRQDLFFWAMGPDYIAEAFHEAHDADPTAKLAYNDFGIEVPGPKQDGVFALVDSLLAEGVPVHEVGIQMHTDPSAWSSGTVDIDDLRDAIHRFGTLGVDVYITELDVRLDLPGGTWEQRLDEQKEVYHAVATACHAEPACRGVTTWGFTDAHHYLPDGMALPFDASYQPKPAFEGLRNGLMGLPVDTPAMTSCPLAGSVFCDPLESNTFPSLGKVQVAGGEITLTDEAYMGLSAARAYSAPAASTRRAYVSHTMSDLGTRIWTRAYIYAANPGNRHFTAMAMDEPGAPWHGVSMGSEADGRSFIRVAGATPKRKLGPAFPRNRWVCVEMRIDVANSGGKAVLYFDGTRVARVRNADTQMSADYGSIKAGIIYAPSNTGTVDVRVDELAVGTSRLGCD